MSDDLFESPKLLIDRAREHTDALEAAFNTFFGSHPYAKVVDYDPQTGQNVYKIRLTGHLPGRLKTVAKDVLSNLRESLDHAIYAAAVSLGAIDPRATAFPFANDATHLQGELRGRKLKDIPPELYPMLEGFKPYPGGNDTLVSLNRTRNPGTHRILVPVGFASVAMNMEISSGVITGGQIGYSRWDPAKNEVEYMRLSHGSHMNYNIQVAFDVTFGDVETVRGKSVLATLREFATEVDGVVLAIEAETKRLLASP